MNAYFHQDHVLRVFAWVSALALVFGTLLAGLLYQPTLVSAAQVTSRSITLGSSAASAETTYRIQFTVPDNGTENIGSFRVEFCNNNPLPNQSCTNTAVGDDVPQVDANAGNIATLNGSPTFNGAAISMTAPSVGDYYLDFTLPSQQDIASAQTFDVTVNDVNNPSNSTSGNDNDSFYARVYVYSSIAPPAAANPMPTTNQNNDGGIALSTAQQLTVTARVQEVLQFCIGTTDAATNNDCTDISGTTVDLGVVDNTAVSISPVAPSPSGGNSTDGLAMVRTNAANGVTIGYFAEQESGSGALKVAGATCSGVSLTDQCFNSAGTTSNTIVAGTEEFGMTVSSVDTSNGSTTNLSRDAAYDGDGTAGGTCTGGDAGVDEQCWAWDDSGSLDTIASSTTVVDDELLVMKFAGTAAITTPTGVYSLVATFIATPTF